MITEIKKGVYWVGVVDWGIRHFHGRELSTHRGTTYNSYLIVDKKVVLVDAVWGPFSRDLMANIAEIVDPSKIDIVVANHAEVDHSGSLPEHRDKSCSSNNQRTALPAPSSPRH